VIVDRIFKSSGMLHHVGCEWLPKFRRNVLRPSSGSEIPVRDFEDGEYYRPKRQYLPVNTA
jgi:hypothetical protein